jgi:hypothetical protein
MLIGSRGKIRNDAPLNNPRMAMITERKLSAALTKIARSQVGHPHGKPMSGLSIPAEYHFEKKSGHKADLIRSRKPGHTAAR